jgi:peptidyl-tRNA hydrolase, PTH1 family
MSVWLVAGLGNPGELYAGTRHNAGYLFVARLAADWGLRLKGWKGLARAAEAVRSGESVMIAQPRSYMNLSGRAIGEILERRHIALQNLVVAYDDLDLPLGQIRVRPRGGPGTHNGMRSVTAEVGGTDFPRIRLGIGPLPDGVDPADFVLSPFDPEERAVMDAALPRAAQALDLILSGDMTSAMSMFNRKPELEPPPDD